MRLLIVAVLLGSQLSLTACVTPAFEGSASLKRWDAEKIKATFPLGRATLPDVEARLGACPIPSVTPAGAFRPDGTFDVKSRNCQWIYYRGTDVNCGSMKVFGCPDGSTFQSHYILMRFDAQNGTLTTAEVERSEPAKKRTLVSTLKADGTILTRFRPD
jgi:hypothetical protein